MGEYAERESDRQEIKIGTCESMYYLRYSDRNKVRGIKNSLDPNDEKTINVLRWRLPFPDEDEVRPGDYENHARGATLCNFSDPSTAEDHGILQLHSKTGLLVNIACYHGEKKPKDTKEVQFHWNGKGHNYELRHLKFIDGVVFGVYSCVECDRSWRAPLKELLPFMIGYGDQVLLKRLKEWYVPEMLIEEGIEVPA